MLSYVWQCKYEIDYDLVCSFKDLETEIDNVFIGKRNADYVWCGPVSSDAHLTKIHSKMTTMEGKHLLI